MALLSTSLLHAQPKPVAQSVRASHDVSIDTNADAAFWRATRPIYAEMDKSGKPVPGYRTEIRSRWTKDNLYFLFLCPYQHPYVKPSPDTAHETYELWNWNVAGVFIGSDFADIKHYKEFEISPQNEWVDLDIDLHKPHHEAGWRWNSGFAHAARVDEARHVWFAALRIPISSLTARPAGPGVTFRVNFYRTEGPPQNSKEIMWQPVMSDTFHVPEHFGLLRLVSK